MSSDGLALHHLRSQCILLCDLSLHHLASFLVQLLPNLVELSLLVLNTQPLKFLYKPLIMVLGIQIGAKVPHAPPPLYIRPRSYRVLTVMKGIQCMKKACMTVGYNTYPLPMTHNTSLNQCKKPQPAIIVLALDVRECYGQYLVGCIRREGRQQSAVILATKECAINT